MIVSNKTTVLNIPTSTKPPVIAIKGKRVAQEEKQNLRAFYSSCKLYRIARTQQLQLNHMLTNNSQNMLIAFRHRQM